MISHTQDYGRHSHEKDGVSVTLIVMVYTISIFGIPILSWETYKGGTL